MFEIEIYFKPNLKPSKGPTDDKMRSTKKYVDDISQNLNNKSAHIENNDGSLLKRAWD